MAVESLPSGDKALLTVSILVSIAALGALAQVLPDPSPTIAFEPFCEPIQKAETMFLSEGYIPSYVFGEMEIWATLEGTQVQVVRRDGYMCIL